MAYGRDNYNAGSQGEYFGARDPQDTDHYSERRPDGRYSSAADYAAAGRYGDNERGASQRYQAGDDHQRSEYGAREYGRGDYGNSRYGQRDQQQAGGGSQNRYGYGRDYQGSYAHDGHRFAENRGGRDDDRSYGDRSYGGAQGDRSRGQQGYGRQPQGYDYEDRGFLARAGDEVRSWFGDDEAERRRELDTRYDERQYAQGSYGRDDDYHQWRRGQIDALDRDYHEYRQENRGKFENEFGSWRTERQGQRGSLSKVTEHMDVVGSDGQHIGTVDKVRGDRIVLTKNDADAGGRHHSIPSRWIETVDDKVTVRKTAEEAKSHWRDEENNQAMFGDDAAKQGQGSATSGSTASSRSFSSSY